MFSEVKETMDNFFKTSGETVQATLNAGMRMQEDLVKFWTQPFVGTKSFEDLRKRSEQFATEWFGLVQKNVAEQQKAFDASCKVGLELTRKAFDTSVADDKADLREKTQGLWNTTFDAIRTTAETGVNTGLQMFENWTSFVTRSFNGHEKRTPVTK